MGSALKSAYWRKEIWLRRIPGGPKPPKRFWRILWKSRKYKCYSILKWNRLERSQEDFMISLHMNSNFNPSHLHINCCRSGGICSISSFSRSLIGSYAYSCSWSTRSSSSSLIWKNQTWMRIFFFSCYFLGQNWTFFMSECINILKSTTVLLKVACRRYYFVKTISTNICREFTKITFSHQVKGGGP